MDKKQAAILTVDLGTSSTKVICFDYSGREVFFQKGSYPTFHPSAGRSEQDPEQVFITVLFLLKSVLNNPQFTKTYAVQALVFSSAMHSVVPVDQNGVPLNNAIIWSDNRAGEMANTLWHSDLGKKLYARTGTPVHAMSPLLKIKWFKENDPGKFEKTAKFISLKEYIVYQLTGEYYVDYSLASATGIFNLEQRQWDSEALAYLALDESYFSQAVPIYFSELKIKPQLLSSLKLSANTKMIIGSSDGCLASLCMQEIQEDRAVVSVTSSGAVRVFGKSAIKDKRGRFFNYVLDDDWFISGGPTNNGGVALEWVAKALVRKGTEKSMERHLDNFQNDAEKVEIGANGLVFLPYIQGERAPIWDSNARGTLFGLNIVHEPKHIIRATVEGVLFEIFSIANAIKEYRELKCLYLNGYYASHPLWSSIICNLFGLPVKKSKYIHNSNLGAAMVALVALGEYKNLSEALEVVPPVVKLYPNAEKTALYARYYAIFEQLTYKLKPEFDAITKLQQEK
ncbi:gluconokinase [Marinilongibacter aquaticus]|uniref:gluconokinase n=1 Tax=Marinilongibacter aquaticus TaxID=2975157 RepID=UPI0021BD38BE|nr:gluconokinase [Marinilongibacter aquaticus]UBM57342.1 gluconokinase [Marinilongibacter aquaticus]